MRGTTGATWVALELQRLVEAVFRDGSVDYTRAARPQDRHDEEAGR